MRQVQKCNEQKHSNFISIKDRCLWIQSTSFPKNYLIWLTIIRSSKLYYDFSSFWNPACRILNSTILPDLSRIIKEYTSEYDYTDHDAKILQNLVDTRLALKITTDLSSVSHHISSLFDVDVLSLRQYDLRVLNGNTLNEIFDFPIIQFNVRSTKSKRTNMSFGIVQGID